MTLVYIAVPIDGIPTDHKNERPWSRVWFDLPGICADFGGVVGYHPNRAFTVGPDTKVEKGLERVNRAALEAADALLALLPAGVPSVGVPREVEAALAQGKPVAVITDMTGRWSLADVPTFPMSMAGAVEALGYLRDSARVSPGIAADEIYVVRTTENGQLPTRAYPGDAGFDLHAAKTYYVEPGGFADIRTDLRVAMPPTMWGRIVGRSSTFRKRRLLALEGVIDSGYRGEIYAGVTNLSAETAVITKGDRIAQFIPHANVAHSVTLIDTAESDFETLPHDGRGSNGFGSSGT